MQMSNHDGETWYVNDNYASDSTQMNQDYNQFQFKYDNQQYNNQQQYGNNQYGNQQYNNQQQYSNQQYSQQQYRSNQYNQQSQIYDQSYLQYAQYNQFTDIRTMSHHIVDRVYRRIQGFKATNGNIMKQWLLYLVITFGISIVFMLCFPDIKSVLAGEGFKIEDNNVVGFMLGNLFYLLLVYCFKPLMSIGFFDVMRWYFYGKSMKFVDSVKHNIKNKVKVLSTKAVTIDLWTLVFIIPGILKGFEYYFVECLLLDNPNMSWQRAFELSKILTNGRKMDIFTSMLNFKLIWRSLLFGLGTLLGPVGCNLCVDTSIIPSYSLLKMEWYEQALQEKVACGAINIHEIRG